MAFDPRAEIELFVHSEEWSEWIDELMDRFAASPEADALPPGSVDSWTSLVVEYCASFHGENLATLTPHAVEDVVLEVFPRKVSADPRQGGDLVQELRAFCLFAARAFDLPNMAGCAEVFAPEMEERVRAALADTSRYGMAKSMLMRGTEAGFDMSTEEGLKAWMMLQNPHILDSLDPTSRLGPRGAPALSGKARAEKKAARKRQRKARRKNRR